MISRKKTSGASTYERLWIENIVFGISTTAIVSIFFLIVLGIAYWGTTLSPWLSIAMAPLWLGGAIVAGVAELNDPKTKKHPLYTAVGIFGLILALGTAGVTSLSWSFEIKGWATYESTIAHDYWDICGYYLWLLLDMIPGLQITESLWPQSPVTPHGFVAGIPVVLFRAFVLFGLFGGFRSWLNQRKRLDEKA